MSADNGIIIRKNKRGNFVAQMYFASSDEYPDIDTAQENQIFETLEAALEGSDVLCDWTEYGTQVDIRNVTFGKNDPDALDPNFDQAVPELSRNDIQVMARFSLAQDEFGEIKHQMRTDQVKIRAAVVELATEILKRVPDNRERSLALTSLEESLMWAGKAIFK